MKIRTKLILVISAIIVVISSFITTISLITNYNSSKSLVDDFIPKVVRSTSEALSNQIEIYLKEIDILSRTKFLSDEEISITEKVNTLSKMDTKIFKYYGIYDKSGKIYSANNEQEPVDKTFIEKSMNGEVYFSEPYVLDDQKTLMGLASAPIKDDNGNIKGVFFGVFDYQPICDLVKNTSVSENTSPTVYNKDGTLMAYSDPQFIIDEYNLYTGWLDGLKNKDAISQAYDRALNSQQEGFEYLNVDGETIVFGYAPIRNTQWAYNFYVPLKDFLSSFYVSLFVNIISTIIFIILGGAIVFIFGNNITKPVSFICERMIGLSKGDLKTEVQIFNTKDEMQSLSNALSEVVKSTKEQAEAMEKIATGDYSFYVKERSQVDTMSQSMNKMIESNKKYIKNISDVMKKISEGDLNSKITDNFTGDFMPIKESINNTISILDMYIQEISKVLKKLSDGDLSEHIKLDFIGDFDNLKVSINHMINAQRNYIMNISNVMDCIKNGDLSVNIDIDYKGDYAPIKESINATTEQLKYYMSEIARVLGSIAQGDLTCEIEAEFIGDYNEIKENLINILDSLNETLQKINESADQVAMGAVHIAEGSQQLSQGAVEQASAIEKLTKTTSEISEKVNNNSKSTVSAIKISNDALDEVKNGNVKMNTMIEAMNEISNTSNEIEKIVKTISDIAFQTNILALNAAVEAARAGEAGKSFSVVAEEVQNLASKSGSASKDISTLIENSVRAVTNGEQIAQDTAQSLIEIVSITQDTTKLIENIAKATEEQAVSSKEISNGLEQISSVVQNNSATSQESAASSEELSSQAQVLKSLINKFKFK